MSTRLDPRILISYLACHCLANIHFESDLHLGEQELSQSSIAMTKIELDRSTTILALGPSGFYTGTERNRLLATPLPVTSVIIPNRIGMPPSIVLPRIKGETIRYQSNEQRQLNASVATTAHPMSPCLPEYLAAPYHRLQRSVRQY